MRLLRERARKFLSLLRRLSISNRSLRFNRSTFPPTWSPEGEELLLPLTEKKPDLYLIDVDGRILSPLPLPGVEMSPPPGRPMGRKDRPSDGNEGKSDIYSWIRWGKPQEADKGHGNEASPHGPRWRVDAFVSDDRFSTNLHHVTGGSRVRR